MFKTLALVVVALLAGVLLYAATRPDSFQIERSIRIEAPPEKVFALIHDLRQFNRWNPYEKKDPAIQGSYGKVEAGPGASYAWVSGEVGVGSMEIVESIAPSRVAMKLDFVKPFEAHNQVVFTVQPAGSGSEVRWLMQGPSPYVSKLMGLIFNMDKMIGKDFDDGLANLKRLAETQ